ncbi:basic amino acid ABC transporter substrate-binding protein [Fusobacterium sp.]|uniref:basic amino acid ABC transporter substrate-binding protein n=1 Tax=Fusobacterium sp. TaxID=68766 RepID=UPI0026132430|nr:basic amino acid ABC transporter substrate-binding protein [Fusobacterium sp.]
MKKVFKVCGILLAMFMFVACGKEEKKVLYVGTNAEFPPFEYLEKDQMVGFDIDFINALGKELGKEIVMKDMSFDGLLPALQSKKVDIVIAGMTASEERKNAVNFSEPYYSANQVIVLNENNTDIKDFEDLKDKKIGVMLGFTGDLVITEMGLPSEKFSAAYAGIMALQNGKLDAVVLDSETATSYVKNNKGLKLAEGKGESEDYAIAIRKDDKQLLEDINKAIVTLKSNGEFDKILKKYFN